MAILQTTIKPGTYRHYKGQKYRVFFVAQHSETQEPFVVYQCLYGDHSHWIRPLSMFTENVTIDGIEQPRFQLIKSQAETM